jgi:peptide chain release factor
MIRLLFTSGRGPAECRIAVRKAVAALAAEAASLGLETDCLEGPNADGHGPASAIVVIHGDAATTFARPWIGAIQWAAQSPLRPHHKRKNWFIGVFELPAQPEAPKALAVQDVRFEAFRAGGPGGQHQNKTESAVRATHIASGLSVVAREERSQHRNKALALERIAALLKLQGELQAITAQNDAHAAHDRLERGSPVKRFKGTASGPRSRKKAVDVPPKPAHDGTKRS